MAHFFRLKDRMMEVTDRYFEMTQAASDGRPSETGAVVKIQCVYRASKLRKVWHAVVGGVRMIQRCIRGWLAQTRMKALRYTRSRRLSSHFFNHCAAVIQKFFRGWQSRRKLHDFYGRKAYLEKVGQRGEWTVDFLRQRQHDQLSKAKAEEEEQMRKEFVNLAGDLHHLVSTKTIPGVYNPPYNDMLPRAFEKPIEQHLRDACRAPMPRALRRPRHHRLESGSGAYPGVGTIGAPHAHRIATEGQETGGPPQDLPDREPHASRSASAGRMQRIQGPFRSREQIEVANAKATNIYRTVRSSGAYDAVEHDAQMQRKLSKLTRVSPADFAAPMQPTEKPPPSSVHINQPHREKPVELRNDYCELPKIRDKPPFFTAMQKDRHFDEYHEQPLLPSGHV